MPADISVVIPTLDEAAILARCLDSVEASGRRRLTVETVISDGGSCDTTIDIARTAGARVVRGPRGRGPQLNRGAAATSAPVLLFLHADTTLPEGALEAAVEACRSGAVGGAFRLRFDDPRARFRLASRLISWRTRLTRLPLGDQVQFVRRSDFEVVGRFPDWPILEDLDLARRLRAHGPLALLDLEATTAARRYARGGLVRTAMRNWLIWTLFASGVPPQRLRRLYRHVR